MSVALPTLVRLNTTWPSGSPIRALATAVRNDAIDGGTAIISGSVYLKGPPQVAAARRVRLHDRLSGRIVRETWSRPADGYYAFAQIKAGTYYVVAFDHTGTYNAVIKDQVTT